MKKYIVEPGPITSKNDGDIHHISAGRLMELYGVKPSECVIYRDRSDLLGLRGTFLILTPRFDGDYRLERCHTIER